MRLPPISGLRASHKVPVAILAVITLGAALAYGLNVASSLSSVQDNFTRTFERKSWDQVAVAQQGISQTYQEFFTDTSQDIVNLALFGPLVQAASDHGKGVQAILDQQSAVNPSFSAITLLDGHGIMVAAAGKGTAAKNIGTDFSYRDYFKAVSSTKKPYVSAAFSSLAGNTVVGFSSPIIAQDGTLVGVLNGFRRIDQLGVSTENTSGYSNYYNVVCDSKGTLLLSDGISKGGTTNIAPTDQVVSELVGGRSTAREQEVDYRNEMALAQGSVVTVNGQPAFYVVTYFPQKQFAQEWSVFRNDLVSLYTGIALRDLLILLVTGGIVVWIFRRHVA